MNWTVDFLPEAKKDIKSLDKSQWSLIQKALKKVSPEPAARRGGRLRQAIERQPGGLL